MPTDDNLNDNEFALPRRRMRCLQGVAIMLVDDSRSVSEAIRLMAVRSGARLRRADCVASARKHLAIFQPDLIIVDLALPDGTGIDLVRSVGALLNHTPAILIISGADEDAISTAARECGADGYLAKPIANLRVFQNAVLEVLPELGDATPDPNAGYRPDISGSDDLLFDMENMADLLGEAIQAQNRDDLDFAARFVAGVAGTAQDSELSTASADLIAALDTGAAGETAARTLLRLIEARIADAWAEAS